ncbi:MAG: ABC transporter permease [Candidatus Bathyarchaeia archaeon]
MNLIQLFSLAYEALKERRLRAGLTILMVVMGASLIVALNSTSNGFASFVEDQFSLMGANVLILTPRGQNIEIDTTVTNTISKFSGVLEAIPFIQQASSLIYQGEEQPTIVVGMDQSKLPLLFPTFSLETGTLVSAGDRIGALLGSEVARSFDQTDSTTSLGQTVRIEFQGYEEQKVVVVQRSFNIRGIVECIGSGIVPIDQMVFISTSSADTLFKRGGEFDGVYVVTEDPDLNKEVRRQIVDKYGRDIVIISPQVIADIIQDISQGLSLFMMFIASVSLLVASVGIITTLHTSMMERIREIGLLKALGFNNRLILSLFLDEATIIGIAGGSLGILLGMGLAYLISALLEPGFTPSHPPPGGRRFFTLRLTPIFDPINLASTWALCVVLSMVAGFYPAWRASRLDPVVALRHE